MIKILYANFDAKTGRVFLKDLLEKKSIKSISTLNLSESHQTNHSCCRKRVFKCVYLDICLVIAA